MKSFQYVITDEVGIHARPAGLLVKEAKKYTSKLTLEYNEKSAELTKLMGLMALGVKHGAEVTVTAEGEDEDTAIKEIEAFFKSTM